MKKLFIAVACATLLCGCLTSELPFYQDGDIILDDRVIGTYTNVADHQAWEVKRDGTNHYEVNLVGAEQCEMSFYGVLFQLGTNKFLDMRPAGMRCQQGHQEDAPSMIDLLQNATIQPLHMVIEVNPGTNEIDIGVAAWKSGLFSAVARAPDLFYAVELNPGLPERFPRMFPDTRRQREFLPQIAGDTNIFTHFKMTKVSSDK